jgi:hypothetical protein
MNETKGIALIGTFTMVQESESVIEILFEKGATFANVPPAMQVTIMRGMIDVIKLGIDNVDKSGQEAKVEGE